MKNGIVRIKDIAEKAGVSTGTVDRVIHNRGKVAREVEERILKIIEEVGYEPNLMARVLGGRKTFSIGALIPDPMVDLYWQAPKAGIEKAEKELKQYGIQVQQYLFDPHKESSFVQMAGQLTDNGHDGIIVAPIFYHQALRFFSEWKTRQLPFVLFNTHISEFDPLSYIGQDSYQSGMLAGRLIHFGNPAPCSVLIAHIDEELSNAAHLTRKEQGFRAYFEQTGDYNITRAELNLSDMQDFNSKMDKAFSGHADLTSIFVTTSKAFEVAAYLERKNITGIRIIGFDILPENIHYLNRGLIHFLINQNPKGQGYWGVRHLADKLVYKKEVPAIKYLPLDIVTKENLIYYIDEDVVINSTPPPLSLSAPNN